MYKPGDYKVACERCGFVKYYSECSREEKTNLLVCADCLDPLHPQDRAVQGYGERQRVPDPAPEPEVVYTDVTFIDD